LLAIITGLRRPRPRPTHRPTAQEATNLTIMQTMRSFPIITLVLLQIASTASFLHLPRTMPEYRNIKHFRQFDGRQASRFFSTNDDTDNKNPNQTIEDPKDDPPVPQLTASLRSQSLSSVETDNQGPGIITAVFAGVVLLLFGLSAFVPLLEVASTAPAANSNLGNSVVTRQDGPEMKNYQSKFDALSPAKIQDKLRNLPVFYLVKDGNINDKIYFSFNEAKAASEDISAVVKVTTLDQVLYPLILKQGKFKASSTPVEIKQAINSSTETQFILVPSTSSLKDAKETGTTLKQNDVPLFVVERLAFASNDGPQVPLFLERNDAIISYNRLRESGGGKLPADPVIRTTSLLDVLDSMERGTRQGTSQLAFYGNADDVLKADEMSQ
jgi:hypothetical protein